MRHEEVCNLNLGVLISESAQIITHPYQDRPRVDVLVLIEPTLPIALLSLHYLNPVRQIN